VQEARPILGGELRGKACPQQADAQALQIVVEVAEDRDRGARLDASEPRLPTCDKYLAPSRGTGLCQNVTGLTALRS
jgi:hypothetical protein